jgi:hypothetical protein
VLTYCTNIHPGEAWSDVRRNLETHALAVKRSVSPDDPFPLGLRISGRAASELDENEIARFHEWLAEHECSVPTLNGFPHGRFHGAGVKERVYLPDWRTPERAEYTRRLGDILAGWLPEGVKGSISTAPVAFARDFDAREWDAVRRHWTESVAHLARLRDERGVEIVLALEPEPACVVERSEQVLEFFERMALPESLAPHAGVCFDCCHQAVEFEDPWESFTRLTDSGIPIGKVQVSSALRARGEEIGALSRFDEPTYLHQVVAQRIDGSFARYDDLPEFLAEDLRDFAEARVHFHVPIFAEHLGSCGNTRFFLEDLLPRLDPEILLEVETYTFDVLPPELRTDSMSASIVRELEWARKAANEANRRP